MGFVLLYLEVFATVPSSSLFTVATDSRQLGVSLLGQITHLGTGVILFLECLTAEEEQ